MVNLIPFSNSELFYLYIFIYFGERDHYFLVSEFNRQENSIEYAENSFFDCSKR